MKTQNCLSPTKENLSPTKEGLRDCQDIGSFLALVKAAGLKVPSNLEKKLMQGKDGLMKLKSTQNSQQELKKIKIKLGDTQFQLKKIEQDFAQFKLTSRQQKQKQVKKWEQSYNKLKSTLQNSNEDSSIKILKLKEDAENEQKRLIQKHEAQLSQQVQKLKNVYEEKIVSEKNLRQRQTSQLKQKHQKQILQMKQKYETQVIQTNKIHEFEMRKQALKHKQFIQNKQKQFESIYTAIQSQKKTQEKLHQKTKIQSSQAKEKLYSELYLEKNLKKGLEQQIQRLQKQIKTLKITIKDMEVDKQIEKEKSMKRQKKMKSQFQIQKQGQQQLYKQQIANILLSHAKQLAKFQNNIKEMNEWKQNRESLMEEKILEIQKIFNDRPSRKEDLDLVQKIKNKLQRKEEQVRALNKQLRACALEIQNKQETYNKIFSSNTMNKLEKRSLIRDREQMKSRDSLCRKSQTTDIKFLLKVYNKHL